MFYSLKAWKYEHTVKGLPSVSEINRVIFLSFDVVFQYFMGTGCLTE